MVGSQRQKYRTRFYNELSEESGRERKGTGPGGGRRGSRGQAMAGGAHGVGGSERDAPSLLVVMAVTKYWNETQSRIGAGRSGTAGAASAMSKWV